MKLYVLTDLEGATGVSGGWTEIGPGGRTHELAKRMLTGDINACVRAAYESGATDIVVWDGHGLGLSVNNEDVDERVRLITGRWTRNLTGLDSSFEAMIVLGMHSRAGTPNGLMGSTWNDQRLFLNGQEIGEIGLFATMAAELGVPTIMVTGDDAACQEAGALLPGVETVAVKKGLGMWCAELIAPKRAWAMIGDATKRALGKVGKVPLYVPRRPLELKVWYPRTDVVDWIAQRPGVQRLNGNTISFISDSIFAATSMLFYMPTWMFG